MGLAAAGRRWRAGHLLEGNLVRGEARALVVGAGLVTVDVLEAAGLAEERTTPRAVP